MALRRTTGLRRNSPLRQGDKGLTTRRPLERRSHLRAVGARRLEAIEGGGEQPTRSTFRKHHGFTPASPEQRAKVRREGCRVSRAHEYDDDARLPIVPGIAVVDFSHNIDRALGGCDDPDCGMPLRRDLHQLYGLRQFDVLPYATLEEQAHAAGHLGLIGALQRMTGRTWVPLEDMGPGEAA